MGNITLPTNTNKPIRVNFKSSHQVNSPSGLPPRKRFNSSLSSALSRFIMENLLDKFPLLRWSDNHPTLAGLSIKTHNTLTRGY